MVLDNLKDIREYTDLSQGLSKCVCVCGVRVCVCACVWCACVCVCVCVVYTEKGGSFSYLLEF